MDGLNLLAQVNHLAARRQAMSATTAADAPPPPPTPRPTTRDRPPTRARHRRRDRGTGKDHDDWDVAAHRRPRRRAARSPPPRRRPCPGVPTPYPNVVEDPDGGRRDRRRVRHRRHAAPPGHDDRRRPPSPTPTTGGELTEDPDGGGEVASRPPLDGIGIDDLTIAEDPDGGGEIAGADESTSSSPTTARTRARPHRPRGGQRLRRGQPHLRARVTARGRPARVASGPRDVPIGRAGDERQQVHEHGGGRPPDRVAGDVEEVDGPVEAGERPALGPEDRRVEQVAQRARAGSPRPRRGCGSSSGRLRQQPDERHDERRLLTVVR